MSHCVVRRLVIRMVIPSSRSCHSGCRSGSGASKPSKPWRSRLPSVTCCSTPSPCGRPEPKSARPRPRRVLDEGQGVPDVTERSATRRTLGSVIVFLLTGAAFVLSLAARNQEQDRLTGPAVRRGRPAAHRSRSVCRPDAALPRRPVALRGAQGELLLLVPRRPGLGAGPVRLRARRRCSGRAHRRAVRLTTAAGLTPARAAAPTPPASRPS